MRNIQKILNTINDKNIIEKMYLQDIITTTEFGAINAFLEFGKNNETSVDFKAVTAIRNILNQININGTIQIGEGERDNAPMIYIGEKVGTKKGIEVDIAIDPVEGTKFVATGKKGAMSVMAITNKNGLFNTPDIYFNKIAVGQKVYKYLKKNNEKISIKNSIENNIKIISKALKKEYSELSITILDRERHKNIIKELNEFGVNINLISDGDLWPSILTCFENSNVHAVFGTGGTGEAILSASALKCLGGYITGEFVLPSVINNKSLFEKINELDNIKKKFKYFSSDPYKLYNELDIESLVPGNNIVFSASSITGNIFMDPISICNDKISITTFISCSFNKYKFLKNVYLL